MTVATPETCHRLAPPTLMKKVRDNDNLDLPPHKCKRTTGKHLGREKKRKEKKVTISLWRIARARSLARSPHTTSLSLFVFHGNPAGFHNHLRAIHKHPQVNVVIIIPKFGQRKMRLWPAIIPYLLSRKYFEICFASRRASVKYTLSPFETFVSRNFDNLIRHTSCS